MPKNPGSFNAPLSQWFGIELRKAFVKKYGRECTASLLALKFNSEVAGLERGISTETARRWLRGLSFPEPKRMSAIIEWLEIKSLNTCGPTSTSAAISQHSGEPSQRPEDEFLTLHISQDDLNRLRRVLSPLLDKDPLR